MAVSKARNQRVHSKQRVMERYGIQLNHEDFKEIIRQIRNYESTPVDKRSNRISIHIVKVRGIELPVAYDRIRHTVASILPKHVLEEKANCESSNL